VHVIWQRWSGWLVGYNLKEKTSHKMAVYLRTSQCLIFTRNKLAINTASTKTLMYFKLDRNEHSLILSFSTSNIVLVCTWNIALLLLLLLSQNVQRKKSHQNAAPLMRTLVGFTFAKNKNHSSHLNTALTKHWWVYNFSNHIALICSFFQLGICNLCPWNLATLKRLV